MTQSPPQAASYRVVSFHTPDELYSSHAARLAESLDKFHIPHQIICLENSGSWEQICVQKARFIYDQWKESDGPVVWLDADATVEANPVLFENIDADFAIHKWEGWEFTSGTTYFSKTPLAERLLRQWVLRCEADPYTWDQRHLQSAWCDIAATSELKTFYLPRSYCQIFDQPEEEPAVIKHWQASRAKKKQESPQARPFTPRHTEAGREARRRDKPWRTAEESFWISEGVKHIKPQVNTEFPEGTYVEEALRKAIGAAYPVLEVGCGVGRLAALFKPEEYVGIDVNPQALLQARELLPAHNLRLTDDGFAFSCPGSVLFYTVLLHLSDQALPLMLNRIEKVCQKVIIAEIMDERWRRSGNPPVFNRDPETYILEMQKIGYVLASADKYPYERYEKEPWNIGHDTRLTVLTFQPR